MKRACLVLLIGTAILFGGCQTQEKDPFFTETSALTKSTETAIAKQTYRIDYTFELISNHSVGDEWENEVFFDGQNVADHFTVTATPNATVTLRGTVTEKDKIPDKGSATITLVVRDGENITKEIVVRENGGKYTGNIAVWKWNCAVTSCEETTSFGTIGQ